MNSQDRKALHELSRDVKFIKAALKKLLKLEIEEMATLSDLLSKAEALDTAAASFKALKDAADARIAELTEQLNAAKANEADAATIDAIARELDMATAALSGAAAVVANTDAAPVDAPAPDAAA